MNVVRASDSTEGETAPIAATASASVAKRSFASFANIRVTQVSSASGTSGRAARTGGTGSSRCPRITSPREGPSYGVFPASNSYATIPSAYWSAAPVTGCPLNCSGHMYAGVPMIIPDCVSPWPSSRLAMPKSVT